GGRMPRVKGTTIAGRIAFARARGGDAVVDEILAGLTNRAEANELRFTALRSSWYDFTTYVELSEALDRRFGNGDGTLLPTIAGDVAQADLRTVYKVFFRLASPQFIIGRCATIWRQYYDSGEMVVTEAGEDSARFEIRDFERPHRTHCLCVLGWMQRSLELTGVKDARVTHDRCRTAGAPSCVFNARWS
ncbi:MAG: hypothetical protein ACK4N5_26060, partial [Myxococcales bacterium]